MSDVMWTVQQICRLRAVPDFWRSGTARRLQMAHSIYYGTHFLCEFNKSPDPLRQTILTVINCEYESLDLSEMMTFNHEIICVEMERIGMALVRLAQVLNGQIQLRITEQRENNGKNSLEYERPNVKSKDCVFAKNSAKLSDTDCASKLQVFIEDETRPKDSASFDEAMPMVTEIRKKIVEEKQRNCRLELEVEQLRMIQDEHLSRLEVQIKQAEMKINEKLKQKPMDQKKGTGQNMLRKGSDHNDKSLQKNDEFRQGIRNKLVLPQCNDKSNQKVCNKSSAVGTHITSTRKSTTSKSTTQLEEEIKWSRITPISVLGARKRFQQNLAATKKKTTTARKT